MKRGGKSEVALSQNVNPFPKLSYACPVSWAELEGDEKAKFCGKCRRTITNLSELTEEARDAFSAKPQRAECCITYYRRPSGEFVTPENPLTDEERSRIKQLGVAALSAGALLLAAGCMAPSASSAEKTKPAAPASLTAEDSTTVLQPLGIMVAPPPK
jgi:hypothetical protein